MIGSKWALKTELAAYLEATKGPIKYSSDPWIMGDEYINPLPEFKSWTVESVETYYLEGIPCTVYIHLKSGDEYKKILEKDLLELYSRFKDTWDDVFQYFGLKTREIKPQMIKTEISEVVPMEIPSGLLSFIDFSFKVENEK